MTLQKLSSQLFEAFVQASISRGMHTHQPFVLGYAPICYLLLLGRGVGERKKNRLPKFPSLQSSSSSPPLYPQK